MTNLKTKYCSLTQEFLIAAIILVPRHPVYAQLKLGPTVLRPLLSLEQRYDNNIFFAESGRTGSWIGDYHYGGLLDIPGEFNRIRLGYTGRYLKYENATQGPGGLQHSVGGAYSHVFANEATWGIGDMYSRTTDPVTNELPQAIKHYENIASAVFKTDLGTRFFADLPAHYDTLRYLPGETNGGQPLNIINRDQFDTNPRLGFKTWESVHQFVEYSLSNIHYPLSSPNNNQTHGLGTGVLIDLTQKLKGEAVTRLILRHYVSAVPGIPNNQLGLAAKATVTWKESPATTFTMGAVRSQEESYLSAFYWHNAITGAVENQLGSTNFSTRLDLSSGIDTYPQSQAVNGAPANMWNRDFSAGVHASYRVLPEASLLGERYRISLGYVYKTRRSSAGGFSFDDQTVAINLNGNF